MTKQLKAPPIVEVICGFTFPSIAGLDPLLIGKFWSQRLAEFPRRELQPPVADRLGVTFVEGVGPLRAWLISANDEYLVQIQPDRFYFNWRKRADDYPHFRDHHGREGVLSRGLAHFERFRVFCGEELGAAPVVDRLELAKVDQLAQGRHWKDSLDLTRALPSVTPLLGLMRSDEPVLNVRLFETRGEQQIHLQISSVSVAPHFDRAVQIDTRVLAPHHEGDLRSAFLALNDVANDIFFELVPQSELHRFEGATPE